MIDRAQQILNLFVGHDTARVWRANYRDSRVTTSDRVCRRRLTTHWAYPEQYLWRRAARREARV